MLPAKSTKALMYVVVGYGGGDAVEVRLRQTRPPVTSY
jgi:hypothetical protein